jgi:hypothetical protein
MLPDTSFSDEDCIMDYKLRCEQCTTFPGASAFDFAAILDIVIADILGWDEDAGIAFPDGGAFGKINAFSGAVEEQGRKTLHAHMLLYIKELSVLLEALQKSNPQSPNHTQLKRELTAYIDNVMSTKLHRSLQQFNDSFAHTCDTRNTRRPPPPQPVPKETLRANRHKRGCVSTKGVITQCPQCGLTHTSEEHILKRLHQICPEIKSFPDTQQHRIEIWIMRHIYTYPRLETKEERDNSEFLLHAFYNLHRSMHAKGCFNYGLECRYHLPTLHNTRTIIEVHEGVPVWYNIRGIREMHHPFTIKLKREITDVNMNTYNNAASIGVGSNSNTNIGEIRVVFYATTYSSKHSQEDESEAFKRVVDSYIRRSLKRKADEEAKDEEDRTEYVFYIYYMLYQILFIFVTY